MIICRQICQSEYSSSLTRKIAYHSEVLELPETGLLPDKLELLETGMLPDILMGIRLPYPKLASVSSIF